MTHTPVTYELVAVARTPKPSGPPTLTEIAPLVAPTITWAQELTGPGYIAFSCSAEKMSEDIRFRLRDLVANPTEVWLYRNSVLVMQAYVATYQLQNQTLSVTAPGLLGYLRYMMVEDDQVFSGVDQHTIATDLIDYYQGLEYGHYGIDTGAVSASGVTRDRTYLASEQHNIEQRIRELAKAANGFDVTMDYGNRQLILTSPQVGADLTNAVVLDGRNITDASSSVSVAPGDIASDALGVGGDGQVVLTDHKENALLRETWGRATVGASFDGVTSQTTLEQHTTGLLDARAAMLFAPGPGLVPVVGANVPDFDIGDTVQYEYDAGLGLKTGSFRVAGRVVSVDENGQETMAVTFA